MDFPINKGTGMFDCKQAGFVAVIIGVVAVLVGFQNRINNLLLGSCDSWWCDFGSGLLEAFGAAMGAYAGICPFFLGKDCHFQAIG